MEWQKGFFSLYFHVSLLTPSPLLVVPYCNSMQLRIANPGHATRLYKALQKLPREHQMQAAAASRAASVDLNSQLTVYDDALASQPQQQQQQSVPRPVPSATSSAALVLAADHGGVVGTPQDGMSCSASERSLSPLPDTSPSKLSRNWVADVWLKDIGLPQYAGAVCCGVLCCGVL